MPDLPTGTVTFLFSDIEGSTRLLQRLGDRYPELLAEHHALLREIFGGAAGTVVASDGDSLFVVFESAPAAVASAAEAQRALESRDWAGGEKVRVRMGLHTGEGILGGDNYVGIDVHRAARIAGAGHGGQVLLSDTTRALAEDTLPDGLTLRDLGEHRLKDLARPERLSQLVVAELPSDFPPIRSLDARPNNLPTQLTTFVGRQRQIDAVKKAVEESRLLTLTGPGGTGKTRLSLQVGMDLLDRFEDGVFFVGLSSIEDPGLVPTTVAHTLGIREEGARPILETLKEHCRGRELLLILDNFEQITDAAPVVVELLQSAPRLRVLVTSRAVLHVSGEHEYPVPPLELPDHRHLPPLEALSQYEAVALFVERAVAVDPSFRVTNENAPAVAEICTRLDGLPLAIELAAARIRLLSPQGILARLESRLTLLTGGARDLPARQRTLRDAIDWSYDLLDETERALFRRLSAFVGGWTLEGAEAVCNPRGELGVDTLDALASLVDKSLLRRIETDEGEPRFRMLQVIREYAMEKLAGSEEVSEIRRRHAEFFMDLAEEAEGYLLGPEQARWLDMLEVEHDNIRTAVEWLREADLRRALRLAAAMWRFWQMRGFLQEGRAKLTELLSMPGSSEDLEIRARALEAVGGLAYWQADFEVARGFYEESLHIHRALANRAGEANALYNIGFTYGAAGIDPVKATSLTSEAITIFRELRDRSGEAKCLWALSWSAWTQKDLERARPYLVEAEKAFRELDDPFSLGWVLHTLGLISIVDGELNKALRHLREGLTIFADARDLSGVTLLLGDFGWLAEAGGYRDRAVRLMGAAHELARQTGTDLLLAGREVAGLPDPQEWVVDDRARALWAEGEAMTADEAVAYALKDPESEG